MYTFATRILQLLFSSMNGHMNVVNKEKLPQNEPFIVVCTHKSWIDVVCLGIALYPTPIHFMAKKELFNKIFIKKLLKKLNAFPVDRSNPGPSVLKIPLQLLKKKQVVWDLSKWNKKLRRESFKKWSYSYCFKGKCSYYTSSIYRSSYDKRFIG
ncbi:1-acyl-sn-glycerol-3-phosphate acyltransferase [Priestia megaterium]